MYFIISDIHGSLMDLEKALDIYKKGHFSKLIILGDVLNHGPRNPLPRGYDPSGVSSLLNSLKNEIICIRGNCDSEVDQMLLDFPITADYSYYRLGERNLFLTHGHVFSKEKMPPLNCGDIFLYGHTHVSEAITSHGIYILNPGSISLSKGGFGKSYGILDLKGFTIYSIEDSNQLSKIVF